MSQVLPLGHHKSRRAIWNEFDEVEEKGKKSDGSEIMKKRASCKYCPFRCSRNIPYLVKHHKECKKVPDPRKKYDERGRILVEDEEEEMNEEEDDEERMVNMTKRII